MAAGSHRRWALAAAGLIVVVVTTLSVARFLWLPGYRPSLGPGERVGIDVSNHQGPIDWQRVAADGISFAYIKATEGGAFVDAYFARNWAGAGSAGIERGAYHFFSLCSSGATQAQNFLRVVPVATAELAPALDLELSEDCTAKPSQATVRQQIAAYLHPVEAAAGRPVLLYVGKDFEARYPVRSWFSRPRWDVRFLLRPAEPGWSIWQVGSFSEVAGIRGTVDLDVMSGASPT